VAPPRAQDAEAAGEYIGDMLKQMLTREVQLTPKWDFMRSQPHIIADNRATLVDWFCSLRKQLALRRETLFLAVNLVDRYLSLVEVRQRHLQLVGAAAFLIAAKFEEVKPPDVKDLVYYTAEAYTRQDIVKMEIHMLSKFNFEVATPTSFHCLVHLQSASGTPGHSSDQSQDRIRADSRRELAWKLLEGSLMHYPLAWQSPSHLASAALLLSNELSGLQPWPESMVRLSGHSRELLEPLADELHALMSARDESAMN
jgi:hypothetical protein